MMKPWAVCFSRSLAISCLALASVLTISTSAKADTSINETFYKLVQKLQTLAPEHQKAFVKGFVDQSADRIENLLHNTVILTGGKASEIDLNQIKAILRARPQAEDLKSYMESLRGLLNLSYHLRNLQLRSVARASAQAVLQASRFQEDSDEDDDSQNEQGLRYIPRSLPAVLAEYYAENEITGISALIKARYSFDSIAYSAYDMSEYLDGLYQSVQAGRQRLSNNCGIWDLACQLPVQAFRETRAGVRFCYENAGSLCWNASLGSTLAAGDILADSLFSQIDQISKKRLNVQKITLAKISSSPALRATFLLYYTGAVGESLTNYLHNISVHYGEAAGERVAVVIHNQVAPFTAGFLFNRSVNGLFDAGVVASGIAPLTLPVRLLGFIDRRFTGSHHINLIERAREDIHTILQPIRIQTQSLVTSLFRPLSALYGRVTGRYIIVGSALDQKFTEIGNSVSDTTGRALRSFCGHSYTFYNFNFDNEQEREDIRIGRELGERAAQRALISVFGQLDQYLQVRAQDLIKESRGWLW